MSFEIPIFLTLILMQFGCSVLLTKPVEAQLPIPSPVPLNPLPSGYTTATLSEARCCLAATSSDNLVFFGGGMNKTGPSNRVDICNVTSGSWTTATLSVPRQDLAAASSGSRVFFAGGWDGTSTYYNTVDIYNVSDGSWSTETLSQNRTHLAGTSVGSFVLFGGGRNSTGPSDVVDIYNVTSSVWTTATLSQARSDLAATSVANRYALFAGGWNGSDVSNVVDIFDLWSGMWNTTTLSQARTNLAATSLGNLAFFGGGITTGSQPSDVVDILNATTQMWNTTTLIQPRGYLAAASIGEVVAFGGGYDGSSFYLATLDLYNITNNAWNAYDVSAARGYLAATASTDQIFFGGGKGYSGPYPEVDIININAIPPILPHVPSLVSAPNTAGTLSPGAVAGIVVGVLLSLFLVGCGVIVAIIVINRRKRKKQQTVYSELSRIQLGQNISTERDTPPNFVATTVQRRSQISFSELVIEREVGEGSYGKVCRGRWNDGVVALKFCRRKGNIDEFMTEVRIMLELPPHPNVVQMYGISLDGPQPVIIMEYCAGGSLDKLLFDTNRRLTHQQMLTLARGIAAGLYHLHKYNIIHRDLAARNILLTRSGDPKISDFGMSRILQEREEGKTYSNVGPIRWMSPEAVGQRKYSKQSDVWSFGIVVWEIVAQSEPHTTVDPVDVGRLIRDQYLTPTIPNNCPQKLREVMELCWKRDPNDRPSIEHICTMLTT